jgi:hypothetical protein
LRHATRSEFRPSTNTTVTPAFVTRVKGDVLRVIADGNDRELRS